MMKKVKFILLSLFFCGITFNTHAQFLKQLKKQVIEKSKEAIIDKTSNKVAENVSDRVSNQVVDALDNVLGSGYDGILPSFGKTIDIDALPAVYSFDYVYSLKIKSTEGDMVIDYFLNKSEPFMGAKINVSNDIFMVFDDGNKALVTIFGGNAIATELSFDDTSDDTINDFDTNYTISNLPNKTIMGYNCVGRLIENDEHSIKIYNTTDSELSISKLLNNKHIKAPSNMKSLYNSSADGLVMYAEISDKTNNNSKATIECVQLGKTDMTIKTR